MCARRTCIVASAGDALPLRAATSGANQRGGVLDRAREHVGVRQQQRRLLVGGAHDQRLVQRHDGERRVLRLHGERAGAAELLEALLLVGVAVRLIEQQPRQLRELAGLLVERREQIDRARPDRGAPPARPRSRRRRRAPCRCARRARPAGRPPRSAPRPRRRARIAARRRTRSPCRPRPPPAPRSGARCRRRPRRARPARRAAAALAPRRPRHARARRDAASPRAARAAAFAAAASRPPRLQLRHQRGRGRLARQRERFLQHAHRRAVIAPGAFQLGPQQVQRQAVLGRDARVVERRADLGDRRAQLAVRDQRARRAAPRS